jgi:hypothetical protein
MIQEAWLNSIRLDSASGPRRLRLLRGDSDTVVLADDASGADQEIFSTRHLGFHIAEVPIFLSGTPAYDLARLNAKLATLLGDPSVDEVTAPYAELYDAIVAVLRDGGPAQLFEMTWHPQRIENVPFILHSPGLTRKLEALAAHPADGAWTSKVRAEIAAIEQDNPFMAPATLLESPLYVWGGAVMDGFITDAEMPAAGRFVADLVAGAPERFEKARLIFQAVAIAHLIAQYVPKAPVDRFVKLCASAGFHIEVRDGRKCILFSYADSGARAVSDALTTPIEIPFSGQIETGSIYLADRREVVDPAIEEAGRRSYLRYLAEHNFTEEQVLPIAPKLAPDQEAQIAAILMLALQQGHTDLVRKVEEARTQNTNQLLTLLDRGFVRRLREGGVAVPDNIFGGVFPTNSFNAHVVAQPNLYLILINTGVFELLGLLAGLFFIEAFGSRAERARQAAEHVKAYCEHRIFPEAADLARRNPGPEFFAWQIHLVTAAEEFALAHELGHVACGHAGGRVVRLALASGHPIMVAAKSTEQEKDADHWALAALTRTFGTSELDRQLSCSGVLFFLATAAVVEAAMAARGIADDTHPPALDRYFDARYALAKAGLDRYTDLGERYRSFALQIARELALDLPDMAATAAVVDHVARLVQDDLQSPVAITFPDSREAAGDNSGGARKTSWWGRLWPRRASS